MFLQRYNLTVGARLVLGQQVIANLHQRVGGAAQHQTVQQFFLARLRYQLRDFLHALGHPPRCRQISRLPFYSGFKARKDRMGIDI